MPKAEAVRVVVEHDGTQQITSTPLARVLIVNYNSGGYLQRCVSALLSQTMRDFEVVVVDNASTDGSLEGLPQDERLRIDRAGVNLGFAAGNNRAAADATAPFLVMLNPDAIPAPDWLERLCDVAKCRPDVALFGSLQLQDRDPTRIDGAGDVYFFAGTAWRHRYGAQRGTLAGHYTTFGACAAAALIRREWFERLGGFDADYFCYFEDVDLAFRLRLLGGHVLQVNDAVVRHAGSATTGAGSDFVMYHCTRNQLWTFLKAMPGPLLLPLLPIHMALLLGKWLNAARQGRGAIIAKGIGDGLRAIRPVLAKRAAIQRTRSASTFAVASAMTWSPTAFLKRGGEGPPPAQP